MKLLEYEDMDVQREYLNQMYRIQTDDIYLARVINKGKEELKRRQSQEVSLTTLVEWEGFS